MPQMGPMPWVFLLLSVLCLVFSYLVILYFFTLIHSSVKKKQLTSKFYCWVW